MIIRENGIVVGVLHPTTLQLTEAVSDKLIKLIEDWRENGIEMMQAGPLGEEDDPSQAAASSDQIMVMPFTRANLSVFHNELLKAGFEVQTD